jgi:hypothetical protein
MKMSERVLMVGMLGIAVAIGSYLTAPAFGVTGANKDEVAAPLVGSRYDGPEIAIGDGHARTYVIVDVDGAPIELGVGIDAAGLEGLPHEMSMNRLQLPRKAPAPFQFAMFDWNPMGHEPMGIYDLPHFDFHFYLTPETAVDAIVPGTDRYVSEANHLPDAPFMPEHYAAVAPPGAQPSDVAVPGMGVHLLDVRSPELQALFGITEASRPFSKTFIYGSWDGRITFLEPMITRQYMLQTRDEIVPIPQPTKYEVKGWYPTAYRIHFDEARGEYRVALTGFEWHE